MTEFERIRARWEASRVGLARFAEEGRARDPFLAWHASRYPGCSGDRAVSLPFEGALPEVYANVRCEHYSEWEREVADGRSGER